MNNRVGFFFALLACVCLSTVACHPKRFFHVPNGKAHVYKYSAVVKSGQNEPSPYASKFEIGGKLIHKRNVGDPDSQVVDYLKFYDVEHTVFNGPDDDNAHGNFKKLDDETKDFEEPILLFHDHDGNFQGFKIQEKEAVWFKNMKMSLVTLMQAHVNLSESSYQITEKTIHGDCLVDYTVSSEDLDAKNVIYVRKYYEPYSCSNYVKHRTRGVKSMTCRAQTEEYLVTSAEKLYEFVVGENEIYLKKIVSAEKISYLPFSHRSAGIQNIETTQVLELENVINESELSLPVVDFKNVPMVKDIYFDIREMAVDRAYYFGRNNMKSSDVIGNVTNFLVLIVDYLRENQIKATDNHPEYKGLTIKLYNMMQNLDSESMYTVYKHFNSGTEKENMMRQIFLEMIPHTGTVAAWNFTKNIIVNGDYLSESTAVDMLSKLPMFVQNTSEEFAKSMIDYQHFNLPSAKIRNAGILCYSILLNKVYQNVGDNVPEFLKEQLDYFFNRVKAEPDYDTKIVYIMAMRNVEVGNIYSYLSPIIAGSDVFEGKPNARYIEKYRRAAMWAVGNSIHSGKNFSPNKQIWGIFINKSEPLSLRLTAYELLVPKNPKLNMNLLMRIYWFMTSEKDEHFFNYHYTTLSHMAESTDPCMKDVSEITRKVLRLTRRRHVLSTALSAVNVYDYFDDKFGYGKTFKIAAGINEDSGIPQYGYYESTTISRKSSIDSGIYWNIDGVNLNKIISLIKTFTKELDDSSDRAPYEITDEKVRNLLKNTYGHKLLDKHIHIEFWSINGGYVTNVEVLFENGLSEYFKEHIESYKPRDIMDVKEKFDKIWLDVAFHNQFKAILATDIGFPAIFYIQAPVLSYSKIKPSIFPLKTMVAMKLEFEAIINYHNTYKLQFYNPFADLFQAVRRDISVDFAFPIDMTISLNMKTYGWKILLPRLPETRFSVAGLKTRTMDEVKISKDYNKVFKTYCPSCEYEAEITKGPSFKNNYVNALHSKETGLQYIYNIYNCESYRTSTLESEEMFRVFRTKMNNAREDWFFTVMMMMQHGLYNFVHAPYATTCEKIVKVSPCTVHPTSQIEMNLNFMSYNADGRKSVGLEGSVEMQPISANGTGSFWDVKFEIDTSQLIYGMKFQATNRIPEETNYKVCLGARKIYPDLVREPLKQETNTKITLDMGYTNNQQCSFDDDYTSIAVAIKGELLEEQVEKIRNNVRPGSCFKNPTNSFDMDVTQRFDWNCLYETVKGTTMRKETFNVTYDNISPELLRKIMVLDEFIRYDGMPRLSYSLNHTEPGNVQIVVSYSMNYNYANMTVMTPYFTREFVDTKYGSEDSEDRKNDINLDNIVFSTNFLMDFYKGEIRPCIAHANDVITDLNQTIPMTFQDWTLLSGDHELMTYAVFIKAVGDKVAVKIYASMHVLEIQPGNEKPIVTFDGRLVEDYEKEAMLPSSMEKEYYFKLAMVNQLLMVETEKFARVKIFYTPYNIVVLPHIILDRNIDGVCGHMGSTPYVQDVPLVYGN